jgi:hypothetical protein
MPTEAPRKDASANAETADFAKFLLYLATSLAILTAMPLVATDWKSFDWSMLSDAPVASWSLGFAGVICFVASVQARKLGGKAFVAILFLGVTIVAFALAMFVQDACKRAEMASALPAGHPDVAHVRTTAVRI